MNEKNVFYTKGEQMMKYLSQADYCFSAGDYINCERHLKNFVSLIEENSPEGKELQKKLDTYEQIREQNLGIHNKNFDEYAGYFEKSGAEENRSLIEINYIQDKKCACWTVAWKYNLFFER